MSAFTAESRAYFRALGKHITVLRNELDMTQAELARILGVSQQTVFAYELGDRRVSVLMMITLAKVFGVPVEELMGMVRSHCPTKRRLSPAGIRHAQLFAQLSKKQQRFVTQIIDVLLQQNSLQSPPPTDEIRAFPTAPGAHGRGSIPKGDTRLT